MRRALPLLLLVLLAIVVGAAAVWPAPLHPSGLVPATPFTDGHRIALGFGAGTLGPRIIDVAGGADYRPLLWPANLLAGLVGPTRALVAVFTLTPLFNAACGWILGRALRLGPWSAFVLGAAVAWNPWVHATLTNGQLEQAVIGGAALVWAAAVGPRRVWVAAPLTAVVTCAVGTAAPHVALAACAGLPILGVGAVVAATRRPRPAWREDARGYPAGAGPVEARASVPAELARWVFVVGAAAAGALLAARYHAASFDAVVRLFAPFGSVDGAPVGAQVKRAVLAVDLLRPPQVPPRLANGVVHSGYLGWALAAAALGGLYWRRAPLFAGLACLALAFGSGGGRLPYALLEALSPTVAASGTPYRFLIGAVVGLAASAAAIPWGPRGALALVALLWADGWRGDPRPLPLATEAVVHDASTPALAAGEGPVLDLPVSGPRCKEGATHYLLEAIEHGRPVPIVLRPGYEAWPRPGQRPVDGDFAKRVDGGLAGCDAAVIEAIRAAGFTAIVAHGHHDCNLEPAEVACLRRVFGPGQAEGKVVWWEIGG